MISIIIPTLNEENYVGKLLSCIQKQDYGNYETIVADGRSADKTKQIVSRFRKTRFYATGFRNSSMQRNFGARKAKGSILLFLDADILIPDRHFFSAIAELFKDKSVVGAMTRVEIAPHERTLADSMIHLFFNRLIALCNRLGFGAARGACMIIRKEYFPQFNEKAVVAEDVDLFRRLRKKGEIHFFKELTVYESARRYRKYGYIRTMIGWIINGIAVFLLGRSLAKTLRHAR